MRLATVTVWNRLDSAGVLSNTIIEETKRDEYDTPLELLVDGTYALLPLFPGTDPEVEEVWMCRRVTPAFMPVATTGHRLLGLPFLGENGLGCEGHTEGCGSVRVVREVPQ